MKDLDNDTKEKKVVIIGGGPAGLTASYQLSKAGLESIVLEKEETVGGISRTVNYRGYYFDIGGHRFFTKIKEVEEMWKEVLGDDFLRRNRLSRIYYNKRFFYYPFRPFNALMGLGIWNSFLILASYLRGKMILSKDEETFEQWVSNRFGRRLFHIFFETYTEKVWGIPCSEIRAEWAAQRIKGLSLISAVKNALIKPEKKRGKKNSVIKTLIDEFDYPKYGPGMMWQKVADEVRSHGSKVRLGSKVIGILREGETINGVEVQRNGHREMITGTDFISSMPIREAIQILNPPAPQHVLDAANALKYRDFLTVALIINKADIFPDNWIYIHDENVKVGRIQNFKNWSPFMVPDVNKTCLGLEYFCFEGDDFWRMSDEELIEVAKKELEDLGFVQRGEVEDGAVVRMPKAYPVYDSDYQRSLAVMRNFLEGMKNFHPVGRNGQHKYNNQDHSMLTAMMATENVLGNKHDVWQVNEDPDYHEEITEKILIRTFARLDKSAFATALAFVTGMLIFLATIFQIVVGEEASGPTLQLLNQYFIGYTVTVRGALLGGAYGFFWGFIFGWLIAYTRNVFIWLFIRRVKKKAATWRVRNFLEYI